MSSNACGNCGNFRPQKGARFFNCTSAKQAGIGYGMQVRADTRACDSFAHSDPSSAPKSPLLRERAEPSNLQSQRKTRLKLAFLIALVMAIVLLSWLLYSCSKGSAGGPALTPTPVPGTTSTPTPTPLPPYVIIDFPISASTSAIAPDRQITVYSASRTSSYPLMTGKVVTAPSGTIFIIFRLTAMNLGKSNISIQSSDFSLSDSQGHQFTAHVGDDLYYVGDPFGAVLAPSQTDDGKLLYLVPIGFSGFELSYLLEPASVPPAIARWKLNY